MTDSIYKCNNENETMNHPIDRSTKLEPFSTCPSLFLTCDSGNCVERKQNKIPTSKNIIEMYGRVYHQEKSFGIIRSGAPINNVRIIVPPIRIGGTMNKKNKPLIMSAST